MRLAYKVWSGVAAGVFCLVAIVDVSSGSGSATTATVGSVSAPAAVASDTASSVPGSPAAGASPPASPGENADVIDVIDGDTFRLTGGRVVRVLGIDSCEAATPGGRSATTEARSRLLGASVTLEREPGVDDDRYGRALRYVSVGGADFAAAMVVADHTAIYTKGHNDASAARQAQLRALDGNGRTCGDAAPTTSSTPASRPSAPDPDVDRPRTRAPAVPAPAPSVTGPFANCAAARAAGAAPVHIGEPGYGPHLDRDHDGTGCDRG